MTPKTPNEVENAILDMGYDVLTVEKGSVSFLYKGNTIIYYLKKQWASGKGINDGRGWDNLVKQIKPLTTQKTVFSREEIIKAVKEALCEDEMQENTNYNDIAESVYYKLYPYKKH